MKKVGIILMALLMSFVISIKPADAAYIADDDIYIEVTAKEARYLADLMGLAGIELGKETADLSFQMQEKLIAKIERLLGIEINHYYIWLTINGVPVLAIDPPHPLI
jgi:MarR family transcriptional regulator, temperature-dependent positive regulator of motility